jgi:uncharacterized OB-fold protein
MSLPAIYPRKSVDTEPYWEGCRRGELRFQRCQACSEPVFHPRALCPYCLSDELIWERSSGHGTVYSFSVQHMPLRPAASDGRPRILGIAALAEGFHMFAEFVVADGVDVAIGVHLVVCFERISDDLVLPKFKVMA